ncbi:LysR family transcriptional regulator [Nonomuraea sp. NPDC049714]|uniref:LysR family transcriptional regulator n=1 Tax=Nonomuraea sp. NPDC049714 TaxID=3364357 RepID=UPI0037B9BD25
MELRDIEIFLTLAEELHFGRTAARLHVSQARISQAISQQKRRLGAPLFDRSNRRRISLTPLGRQLRDDLRPVYAGLRDSLERARLAARGITAVLRVGMLSSNAHDLRPYWDVFRARHPWWKLQVQQASFVDPFTVLRRGEVDVLVCWLPIEEPDLTVGPILFAEPRVLAVAADHGLARRTSVSLEVLGDFQHSDVESRPDYWADSFVPPHTRAGRLIERGPFGAQLRGDPHLDQPGGDRQPLPRPHDSVLGATRHRLLAGSRHGRSAVRAGLAQRSRNRPHPRTRAGRPRPRLPPRQPVTRYHEPVPLHNSSRGA